MRDNWKDKEYFELTDLMLVKNEFQRIFKTHKTPPIDNVQSFFLFKRIVIDLFKLDDMLTSLDPEENQDLSLKEKCVKYGGEEGDEFIRKLIGGEANQSENGDDPSPFDSTRTKNLLTFKCK